MEVIQPGTDDQTPLDRTSPHLADWCVIENQAFYNPPPAAVRLARKTGKFLFWIDRDGNEQRRSLSALLAEGLTEEVARLTVEQIKSSIALHTQEGVASLKRHEARKAAAIAKALGAISDQSPDAG